MSTLRIAPGLPAPCVLLEYANEEGFRIFRLHAFTNADAEGVGWLVWLGVRHRPFSPHATFQAETGLHDARRAIDGSLYDTRQHELFTTKTMF